MGVGGISRAAVYLGCVCEVTVALILVGGVLEIVAIVRLALSIKADRQRAAPLFRKDVTIRPPAARVGASLPLSYAIHGREPTIEERVEQLEEQVARLRDDTRSRVESLQNELHAAVQRAAGAIGEEAQARYEALRLVMGELLTADLSHRKQTVFLLITGVSLATAGSFLSLWADC